MRFFYFLQTFSVFCRIFLQFIVLSSGDKTRCLKLLDYEMTYIDAEYYCLKNNAQLIGPNSHQAVNFYADELKKQAWQGKQIWLYFYRDQNRDRDWYDFHHVPSQLDIKIASRFRKGLLLFDTEETSNKGFLQFLKKGQIRYFPN